MSFSRALSPTSFLTISSVVLFFLEIETIILSQMWGNLVHVSASLILHKTVAQIFTGFEMQIKEGNGERKFKQCARNSPKKRALNQGTALAPAKVAYGFNIMCTFLSIVYISDDDKTQFRR